MLRKDLRWRFFKVEFFFFECFVFGGEEVDYIGIFYWSIWIYDCKLFFWEFFEDEEELILSWNVLEIMVIGEGMRMYLSEDNLYVVFLFFV